MNVEANALYLEELRADLSYETWWVNNQASEERAELRERNLHVFEVKYNQVFQQLTKHQPLSKLVFDDEGQPDLEFSGTLFYDGMLEEFTTKQLSEYFASPRRLPVSRPQPSMVDYHTGYFIDRLVTNVSKAGQTEFTVGRSSIRSFFTLCMGVGLGRHLPELIQKTQCRNLFILEPNWEGIYHSLDILDWGKILLEFEDRNGDIFFYIGGDEQTWMDAIRLQTRRSNPMAIDGMHIYKHYRNNQFLNFERKLADEGQLLLTGMGFFYDEQLMISNTVHNLRGRDVRTYLRPNLKEFRSFPAIIVGCGPSLDKNIGDIKRLADQAIVISCGSALGPLLEAGIQPDFQCELENLNVIKVLSYAAEKFDLSDICLVASMSVDKKIKGLFDEIIYYFRPSLCPFPIFSNDERSALQNLDPTVTNVGLAFAIENGFKELYLFGVDLGRRGSEQHHALSSYHYSEKSKGERKRAFDMTVSANFGGQAQTNHGLFWARDTFQRTISMTLGMGHKYFNCSDGVMIKGARPKLARRVEFTSPPELKEQTTKEIIESFPIFDDDKFHECWQPDQLINALHEVADEVIDVINQHEVIDNSDYLIDMSRIFYQDYEDPKRQFASLMLRGSLALAMLSLEYYGNRLRNHDRKQEATEVAREAVVELVNRLRVVAIDHIDHIERGEEVDWEYIQGKLPIDLSKVPETSSTIEQVVD